MRLQHLAEASIFDERTLQKTHWTNPKQLIGWLKNNGFEQKGSGSFGAAFVKKGYNRIIKISKKQDDCWVRFAKWAMSTTSNPALPDISWMKTYRDQTGEQFFIAVVEKLAPFNQTAINNTVDLPGLVYMYLHEDWFQLDMNIGKRLNKEGFILSSHELWQYRNEGKRVDHIAVERRRLLKYLREVNGGKRFILTLKAAENKATGRCSYDMHEGNIMYRPTDKRLVLIDPLADLNDSGFYF